MFFRKARGGFTLLEIMIVIVIIGLLAGLVATNVQGYLNRAKRAAARTEIATICQALETFNATYSRYPTNEEGIAVLCRPSEKLPDALLKEAPIDPWGHAYQYNSPGSTGPYEVISFGADGREGGQGANADITSDKLKE